MDVASRYPAIVPTHVSINARHEISITLVKTKDPSLTRHRLGFKAVK